MTDYMGYPQHPDAHPERPWWRKIHDGSGWWWERQATAQRRTLLADVDWPDALDDDEAIAWYDAEVARLTEWARSHGAPELAVPKKIVKVAELPVLGTGKTDYVTIQQLVEMDLAA